MHAVADVASPFFLTEPCLSGKPSLLGDASGPGPHGWYVGLAFVRLFAERRFRNCGLRRVVEFHGLMRIVVASGDVGMCVSISAVGCHVLVSSLCSDLLKRQ